MHVLMSNEVLSNLFKGILSMWIQMIQHIQVVRSFTVLVVCVFLNLVKGIFEHTRFHSNVVGLLTVPRT